VVPDLVHVLDLSEQDAIDARYADEVISKLTKIVTRVRKFQKLCPLSIPNRSVQLAFEKSHRCYMYGFNPACMLMCRATLESALREAMTAAGQTDLSDELELKTLLDLERSKVVLGNFHAAAHRIRWAGNNAAHNTSEFVEHYS
jgi:hypothetical protein